jgi:hypothetical protein
LISHALVSLIIRNARATLYITYLYDFLDWT